MHLAQPPESFGDDVDYHSSISPMTTTQLSAWELIDEIFGPGPVPDSPDLEPAASAIEGAAANTDISLDTRRLQAQHNTVGYREGVTAGKASSIQAGFDRGFGLGAKIGIRAGQVLGLLEGIMAALVDAGSAEELVRASDLLSRATAELNPESLFTSEFWGLDGAWMYSVTASRKGGDILDSDVAEQHPLIATWRRIAHDAALRWRVDLGVPILQTDESSALDDGATAVVTLSGQDTVSRETITW
ncbi:hypothetical protein F5B17DRAFT_343011 [Nemania serpens]|nr:hypothetical protein F5B17DRAFT_343011 [Nemania serpens]